MAMTLRAARLIKGLSQKEMADLIGVSRTTYIKIERNPEKVSIETAKIIAKAMDTSIDDLFFASGST